MGKLFSYSSPHTKVYSDDTNSGQFSKQENQAGPETPDEVLAPDTQFFQLNRLVRQGRDVRALDGPEHQPKRQLSNE
ncbi:MAG: hypothetical protein A2W18_03260 [Candidatus Muproteobacteria bacterium RBG_16_60_9]|uniref:Uncharacterized protein n=1 Tax=Candidatus Muproteobacteria bacterium RBG_16_60_9 TaxID=1817755 RepID=A0A1F6V707_9PROT|nr:MAG: hypothetical protein A2W18_03260 [Candidatus Muproteobacteria bacterium RBG_16_60_9]